MATVMERPQTRAGRKPVRGLLFALILIAIPLAAIEGLCWAYLRWQGFARVSTEVKARVVDEMPNNLRPHARYIWSNQPGTRYEFASTVEKTSTQVRINAAGFRDEEAADRAGADFQFVALGDSFTFGWLVDHAQRWDEQLAQSISKSRSAKCESVNLGMWMATFDQHALVLEENLPADCKLVVHLVYPSHVQTIQRHRDEFDGERIVSAYDPMLHFKDGKLVYGASANDIVSKNLTFPCSLCLLNFQRSQWRLRQRLTSDETVAVVEDVEMYQKDKEKVFDKGWDLTEKSIRQIANRLREKKIPYLVVSIPRDYQLAPEEWNGKTPIPEVLTSALPQERMRQIVERTQWGQYLDLLPAMRERYSPDLYFHVDPHWRAQGHALAAQEILAYLKKHGL